MSAQVINMGSIDMGFVSLTCFSSVGYHLELDRASVRVLIGAWGTSYLGQRALIVSPPAQAVGGAVKRCSAQKSRLEIGHNRAMTCM